MERIDLFSIPIYRKKFEQHDELKEGMIKYLWDKENFRNHTTSRRLYFTGSNLHKEEIFKPFAKFAHDFLCEIMDDLGFLKNIAFTGMWATVHPEGGSHHRHSHHNTFLAGVYYLDGNENSSGTRFFNPTTHQNIMVPARKSTGRTRMMGDYVSNFEEGYLVVFPAWLQHNTDDNNLNRTKSYRKILGINAMPVGMTNNDIFDRYNYVDVTADGYPLMDSRTQQYNHNQESYDKNTTLVDELEYFKQHNKFVKRK